MRLFRLIPLYMALALGANAALATDAETLGPLREGSLKRLILHKEPKPVEAVEFQLEDDGGTASLEDYKGKYVLLNFWATWCAPCRKEMPMLSELQTEFGGDRFEVVTIATGRNSVPGIKKFFADIGVDNLPLYLDPKQKLARDMGVLGLPVTLILDADGQEIARMRGDAEWNSESAKAIIRALTSPEG